MTRTLGPGATAGAVAVALAVGLAAAKAQDTTAGLTLAAALDRARVANPDIIAARLQHPVDAAGVGVAAERPNPDLTYNLTRETPRQVVGMTVPVELGGKRQGRIDLAQATVASHDAETDQVVAEVENDVRHAFYDALAADARVALANDARALAIRARDAARTRAAAGEVAQSDVVQTELELADAEDEVTDARGDATAAHADFNALLGQRPDATVVLAGNLTEGAVPTLEDAEALATRANAELNVLNHQLAEQTARRNLARTAQVPDVTAGAGFSYDAEPDFHYGWAFSLDMTVPLFTRHRAGVAVEDAELARLTAARDARQIAIAGEVASAYARLSAARDRMQHYQTVTTPLTQQVTQLAQNAYDAGEHGLTDLLQALQQVRDIRARGLQASLDFQTALADLERAVGAPLR